MALCHLLYHAMLCIKYIQTSTIKFLKAAVITLCEALILQVECKLSQAVSPYGYYKLISICIPVLVF